MVSGALAWLDGPKPQAARPATRLTRLTSGFPLGRRWLVACYLVFTGYACAMVFTEGNDGAWARWAAGGYAVAAIAAWLPQGPAATAGNAGRSRWHAGGSWGVVPPGLALLFGIVAPVVWLVLRAPATSDVVVVTQSARLLLHHGSPYLPAGQLTTVLSYNPYLPVMAIFGLPGAAGLPGLAGDTRPWLVLVTLVLLAASFWIAQRQAKPGRAIWAAVFAVGSPVLALELAVGITDGPVIALVCLALACVAAPSRRLLTLAGVAVGVACAMKFTAWPALPVIAAMLWARDGMRVAGRFAAVAVVTAAAGVAAFAPALLAHPGTLVQNVVLFPLGLTQHRTPAASPVPGHILASIGPAGHAAAIGLLIAAGAAVAASLVLRPLADVTAATVRLACGLVLLFALAPASRFGYFAYPIALLGWLAMIRHGQAGSRPATDGAGSSGGLSVPTAIPSSPGGAGSAATGSGRPG